MDEQANAAALDMTTEDERAYKLMHKLRAQILDSLSVLKPEEQAAVIYTLGLEAHIREHMPAIAAEFWRPVFDEVRESAKTCQCASCKAGRAQA